MKNAKTEASLGRAPLSAAVEDYLKTIYTLRSEGEEVVTTQALANRLEIAPPSATAMAKKLAQMGLANHTPYRGIELSESGEKIALEVIRHHRIIETYLAEVLGMPWDKIHDEAERLEHVISEEVEARMMEALGHPKRDPHGAPIPCLEGTVEQANEIRLSSAPVGFKGNIARVSDESAEALRHLMGLRLEIDAQIEVTRAETVEGVLHFRVADEKEERIIGLAPARLVWVVIEPNL